MKHLLSLEKLSRGDMEHILERGIDFKRERRESRLKPLAGQSWALIFSKSSTRTRVSFEVCVHELGGKAIFLNAHDIQLGRGEPMKDTARVLGRMVQGAIIRTFAQSDVEEFAQFAGVPTVNALTDEEHPCQILADIFTFQERRGTIQGKVVTFIGDGACNVPMSWIFAAAKLGFDLRIAAPKAFQPTPALLARAGGNIFCTEDVKSAASGSDLLYTDVWVSMGKEASGERHREQLGGYRVTAELMRRAAHDAVFLHCLPAHRGQEVAADVIDGPQSRVFKQAANRMPIAQAVLYALVTRDWAQEDE
jgi:ornithine carbamoyltransferase